MDYLPFTICIKKVIRKNRKVATTVFYIFMIAIIAIGPNGALVGVWFFKALPTPVVYVMVIISVILAFVSLFGYAPGFIRQIKGNKNKN